MKTPSASLPLPLTVQVKSMQQRRKRHFKRLRLWLARAINSSPSYPEHYYAEPHERYEDIKNRMGFYKGGPL
jgi:hypothetical protein